MAAIALSSLCDCHEQQMKCDINKGLINSDIFDIITHLTMQLSD